MQLPWILLPVFAQLSNLPPSRVRLLTPYVGGGFLAIVLLMAAGVPIYVCATASVPIAAGLIHMGASPGAALAFLIAGPATNAATFTTLWKVLGRRTALLYLLSVAASALLAGLALDALVPAARAVIPVLAEHGHAAAAGWPAQLWAILLLGVLAASRLYGGDSGGNGHHGAGETEVEPGPAGHALELTVAGMTCLAVCAGQLEKYQGKQALIKRCMNGISLGEQWLRMNWSVEANLEQPRAANSGSNRWLYYYLYGLERVGSLLNTRFLGGHDWHGEAAAAIVKNQRTDGSWTTAWAEADANTCFALLFLQRGTQTTGREERPTAVDESVKEAAFEIKSNGDNPLVAWVGALNEAVRERLERGETASEAIWSVDGIEVARRPADPKQELTLQRFTLEQALGRNGRHELQAALRFVDAEGQPAGEELSRSLIVAIDSVEDRFHRTAILDASANLVDGAAIRVAASSSHSGGHSADRAVDGRAGTSWLCAANDSEPWIQLRPLRPIRAGTLKLTPGHPYPGSPVDWARPHKIEVSINRGRPLQFELPDGVSTKHTLPFDATGVRSLHIAIKSVHAGLRYPALAGFAEIELFPPDHPGPGSGDEESIWILPPPGEPAAIWRYTKTQPTGEWTRPEHDDSAWASGPAPFDNIGRDDHPRTVWDTQGIWLRRDLELSIAATRRLVFEARVDDSAEIWLNGVLAAEVKTYTAGRYITLQLEPEAVASLHPGRNSLAVKVVDFGGARCFDLLVVRR